MTSFPLKRVKDLKGKKIGAPGASANWLKGTGAVGVAGNLTTYYNDIKTGVYDGVITFATAAVPSKLYEVAPYITRVGFGAQYAGSIAANADWYDGLPKKVKKALKKGIKTYTKNYQKDLDQAIDKAYTTLQSKGAKIRQVDNKFRMEWVNGMSNIAKDWALALDKKGKPGSKALSTYMNMMRDEGAKPLRNWDKE